MKNEEAPMYFLRYEHKNTIHLGFMDRRQEKILPFDLFPETIGITDMNTLIEKFSDSLYLDMKSLLGKHSSSALSLEDVRVLTPIPYTKRNIFCLGKNYMDHIQEMKHVTNVSGNIPKHPIYFSKSCFPAIGPDETVIVDKNVTNFVDYEVELAIIIGKTGINISMEKAYDFIFGYTIANDFSARDLQTKHTQWLKGKTLDTFSALGPFVLHHSSVKKPVDLAIESYVNGELRQSARTSQLIFDIPTIISDLSKGLTLHPGDIILTGTPAGVGMGFNPPKPLKNGDLVTCKIESLGSLSNRIREVL